MNSALSQERTSLAEALNVARIEHHMSVRAAARVAGVASATVQGWLSGRHFPTPALQSEFARLASSLGLEHRLTPSLWTGAEQTHRVEPGRSPYVGFPPYGAGDADLFFGRDAETERLAAAVKAARDMGAHVVFVVGGSGSGKSSLLGAGLVGHACLDSGALRGWFPRFLSLDDLPEAVAITSGPELWIVDQVEDGLDDAPAHQLASFQNVPPGVVVVAPVRPDAFACLAEIPALAEPISRPFMIRPLTTSDAREVIRRPCELVGATVEEGLVELVLRDMGLSADGRTLTKGVLPLLSNTLMMTWASRSTEGVMTSAGYLANGGLAGSINSLAEGVYGSLPERDSDRVQAAFLTLVQVEKLAVRRRSVDVADLSRDQILLLRPFIDERLVSVSDVLRVQISHDAILTSWGRLIDWVAEDRDSLRALNTLRHAAQAWSDNERSDELLTPVNTVLGLHEMIARTWRNAPLTESERDFLRASTQYFARRRQIDQRMNQRVRRQRYVIWAAVALDIALSIAIAIHLALTASHL